MYRRFGFLHARLLLRKQDELRTLEQELDNLDQRDLALSPQCLRSREIDEERDEEGPMRSRAKLLDVIQGKVLEYDQLLFNAQQLAATNKPTKRDYNSVASVVCGYKYLCADDSSFVSHREDLITLRPGRESAWLDAFVERGLKLFPRGMVKRVFCSKASFSQEKAHPAELTLLLGDIPENQRRGDPTAHEKPGGPPGERHYNDHDPDASDYSSIRSVPRQHLF